MKLIFKRLVKMSIIMLSALFGISADGFCSVFPQPPMSTAPKKVTFAADKCTVFVLSTGKQICISKEKMTFDDAKRFCEDHGPGVQLATKAYRNKNERGEIIKNVNDANYLWIGLTDSEEEGKWMFLDGVESVRGENTDWRFNEPNNSNNEDCAAMKGSSATNLNDASCKTYYYALCEY